MLDILSKEMYQDLKCKIVCHNEKLDILTFHTQ